MAGGEKVTADDVAAALGPGSPGAMSALGGTFECAGSARGAAVVRDRVSDSKAARVWRQRHPHGQGNRHRAAELAGKDQEAWDRSWVRLVWGRPAFGRKTPSDESQGGKPGGSRHGRRLRPLWLAIGLLPGKKHRCNNGQPSREPPGLPPCDSSLGVFSSGSAGFGSRGRVRKREECIEGIVRENSGGHRSGHRHRPGDDAQVCVAGHERRARGPRCSGTPPGRGRTGKERPRRVGGRGRCCAAAEDVERLAGSVYDRFGAVDVLCNNAGVLGRILPSWQQPVENWKWVFDVNVQGVVNGIHTFVPRMIAQSDRGLRAQHGFDRGAGHGPVLRPL